LALLVNKLLQIASSDLLKVRDAEDKAYGVEDVGLPGSIQASDGIEERVEGRDDGTRSIGFEAFQRDLLDVHVERGRAQIRSFLFYPIAPSFLLLSGALSSLLFSSLLFSSFSSFLSLLRNLPCSASLPATARVFLSKSSSSLRCRIRGRENQSE
jgi:hypothetical protein